MKNIINGKTNILTFSIKSFFKNFNIDSDKIIRRIPVEKIMNLDLLKNLFSFVNINRKTDVNISIGINRGIINLLYNS